FSRALPALLFGMSFRYRLVGEVVTASFPIVTEGEYVSTFNTPAPLDASTTRATCEFDSGRTRMLFPNEEVPATCRLSLTLRLAESPGRTPVSTLTSSMAKCEAR